MHPRARPLLLARPHAVYSPVWLVGFANVALDIKHTAGDGPYGRRREASTTELLAMGSTCSTLDGVDASRSRASQIEQEQREKDAAALE